MWRRLVGERNGVREDSNGCCLASSGVGLHLNYHAFRRDLFSSPASINNNCTLSARRNHSFAQVVFHPGLAVSFRCLVAAQARGISQTVWEWRRSIDSHHHMHLCVNVLLAGNAGGTLVREISLLHREKRAGLSLLYRKSVDWATEAAASTSRLSLLAGAGRTRGSTTTNCFLARHAIVEPGSAPGDPDEYGPDSMRTLKEMADVRHSHRSCVAQ